MTRRKKNSENTLSKANLSISAISNSYHIQLLEEKRRKRKDAPLKLQYFFDSYDVINLIQGAMMYKDLIDTSFNVRRYEREKLQNLVYAFAYQGLYDSPIRMLEPHKVEFFRKINHSHNMKLPANEKQYKMLVDETLSLLDQQSGSSITNVKSMLSSSGKIDDDYVYDLIQNSPEILRVNFLLLGYASWKKRLKILQGDHIIDLEPVQRELPEIDNVELFTMINLAFKEARPEGTSNNLHDSLAFYHLQKLLEKHKDDPSEPLPVFFSNTPAVRRAIDFIRQRDSSLFSYKLKDNQIEGFEEEIPIVRDPLFFVLEPIFTVGDRTGEFFKDLQNSKPEIRALIDQEYNQAVEAYPVGTNFKSAKYTFEENIKDIIEVRLTQEIWLNQKAYDKFITEIREMISWSENDLRDIEEEIDNQLNEILEKAKYSLKRSRQLSAMIRAFRSAERDVESVLKRNSEIGELDVFRDFALLKFGIDERKLPKLQDLVDSLIDNDRNEVHTPAIYNIMSSLSLKVDDSLKAQKFLQGITMAWLLRKYKLIVELCSQINPVDIQNRYETALIYAASIIASQRNKKGVNATLEKMACILGKKNQNYKVWIGIAYLYYRIWEVENEQNRYIPEISPEKWKAVRQNTSYEKYFQSGALMFVRKAYDYLNGKIKAQGFESEDINYTPYFLYALNNLIFYITKSGTKEQFDELQPFVNELKSYEINYLEWQGRFYDTLGWYNLRTSFYNSKFRSIYLKQAQNYLKKAQELIASPRDHLMYEQLEEAIIVVQSTELGN